MLLAKRITAAFLSCTLFVLAACSPEPAPQVAAPPAGPADTVRHLAQLLQQNDLSGFARAAVPAQDYRTFSDAWAQDLSRWPLSEFPLPDQIVPMLAALSATDAERQLGQVYDRQLAGQTEDLRNAAQTVGLFLERYVKTQGNFTPNQRAHFSQVVPALSSWAQRAPLADASRAHTTLRDLVAAARATKISSDADLKTAGMEASLRQLDPFLAAFTHALADYGLSMDDSLGRLRTGKVTLQGDLATVVATYPLDGKPIQATITLRRQADHWYVASYMDQAEQLRKLLQQQPTPDPDTKHPSPATKAAKVTKTAKQQTVSSH